MVKRLWSISYTVAAGRRRERYEAINFLEQYENVKAVYDALGSSVFSDGEDNITATL